MFEKQNELRTPPCLEVLRQLHDDLLSCRVREAAKDTVHVLPVVVLVLGQLRQLLWNNTDNNGSESEAYTFPFSPFSFLLDLFHFIFAFFLDRGCTMCFRSHRNVYRAYVLLCIFWHFFSPTPLRVNARGRRDSYMRYAPLGLTGQAVYTNHYYLARVLRICAIAGREMTPGTTSCSNHQLCPGVWTLEAGGGVVREIL